MRAALGKRTILIAATGNGGLNAKPAYPAAYPDVIAVTAVDKFRKPYRRAVETELMRSASDMGVPGKDAVYGWGLLNVRTLCQM